MSQAAFFGICFDLVIGFAIWFGVINLVWKIVQIVRTSSGKRSQAKISLAALIIAALGASNSILNQANRDSKPKLEISAPDKKRIREIVRQVWQDSTFLTAELQNEFQGILNKYVQNKEELERTKYYFGTLGIRFQKLFYEDALSSYQAGKALKSPEREKVEAEIISLGMATNQRILENEEMISNIASRDSVTVDGIRVQMTDTTISIILASLEGAEKRIDKLFGPQQ